MSRNREVPDWRSWHVPSVPPTPASIFGIEPSQRSGQPKAQDPGFRADTSLVVNSARPIADYEVSKESAREGSGLDAATPGCTSDAQLRALVADSPGVANRRKCGPTQVAPRDGEELYRLLADDGLSFVFRFRIQPEPKFEFVSPSSLVMTGYSAEEFYADPELPNKAVHPDDRATFEALRTTAPERPVVLRWSRKDGTLLWAEIRETQFFEDGGLAAVEGVVRDVSQRVRAEEDLREAEERFRTLVDQLPSVAYVNRADLEGCLYASPQIEDLTGHTPAEALASPGLIESAVHPEDLESLLAATAHSKETGEPLSVEYRMVAADGRILWVQDRMALVSGRDGAPQFWQGVLTDITEPRRATEALRESEARLQALLSSLDDLAFELDENGIYLGVWTTNDALLAAPRSELLGRTVSEGIGEELGRDLIQVIGRILETGCPEIWEFWLDVPAGIRWFQGRLAPIAGPEGSPGRICLLVRDITAQKAAEHEMSRSLQRLELSHEVDRAILDSDSVADLARTVLSKLRRMVGAEHASVILFDAAAETASFLAVDPPRAPSPVGTICLGDFMPLARVAQRDVRSYADINDIADPPAVVRELIAGDVRSMMSAAIIDEGTVIGEINLTSTRVGGIDPSIETVVREMADQMAVALRQARLKEASETRANELEEAVAALERADAERLELLARLVCAQEDERQRIASDLHDDAIQKVTAASMRLEMLATAHPELEDDAGFVKAKATVHASIESMRHLMFELRPYVLDRDGLGAALRQLFEEEFAYEGRPACELSDGLRSQPPEVARVVLFRITQEALVNVRKHARASRVHVQLRNERGGYFVRVTDDGVGFDVQNRSDSPRGHFGLTSMRQRAQLAGGTCTIESSPARGTSVVVWLPASSASDATAR
jgi:PAS domain S-box-containing protein